MFSFAILIPGVIYICLLYIDFAIEDIGVVESLWKDLLGTQAKQVGNSSIRCNYTFTLILQVTIWAF